MSYAYLVDANLERVDMSGANLYGAILAGANLSCKTQRSNYIRNEVLERLYSDFSGANFSFAYLAKANLSNAYMFGADFSNANLSDTIFSGATMPDGTVHK